MLSSQLYPKSPSLDWPIAIPRYLILLIIFHLINGVNVAAQVNITIPLTSPQILYTPFICNASTALANPQSCAGAWRLSNSSTTQRITTTGPSPASGNIIPQMFFEFQASALFLTTSRPSNASVNLTLSSGGIDVSQVFDSSLRFIPMIGLPQSQPTLLTITYIPTAAPTQFGVQSLVMTVNGSINSVFPTPTLPPTNSLPTFNPTTSSSSIVATTTVVIKVTSHKKMIAEAVGITIGLGLGLTAFAVTVFYYWKRRRQRLRNLRAGEVKSEWSRVT